MPYSGNVWIATGLFEAMQNICMTWVLKNEKLQKNSTLKGMLSTQLNINICSCQYNQLIKHHLYHVWFQTILAYILLKCNNKHCLAKIPHSIMYQIYQAILSPAETSEQSENKPVWKVQTSTDWFANWIKIVLLSSRLNCNRSTLNLLKREKNQQNKRQTFSI